jgi:hypothetical protein
MTEAKKDEDKNAKITDKPDDKNVNESDIPSFMSFLYEDDAKEETKNNEDILIDPFNEPKDASDEIKKMIKENQDELEKIIETAMKNSV